MPAARRRAPAEAAEPAAENAGAGRDRSAVPAAADAPVEPVAETPVAPTEPVAETPVAPTEPVAETPVAPTEPVAETPAVAAEPVAAKATAGAGSGRRRPAAARRKGAAPAVRLNRKDAKKKRIDELRIKAFRDYFNYTEELRKSRPIASWPSIAATGRGCCG